MKLVVTLPPGASPDWARRAAAKGAELLELRTDLIDRSVDLDPFARHLPLLVAERGKPAPEHWWRRATIRDSELTARREGTTLLSHHAAHPLTSEQAEALWAQAHSDEIKHVEPLGLPARLFETQARLRAKFPRVTVLATGESALPFRAALSTGNALEYVRLDDFAAAAGQRLLDDAARSRRADPSAKRFGILGSRLAASRSPRVHVPPFERIDLPDSAPIEALLPQLLPHYAGLAITSPFKRVVANAVATAIPSVNTLVRRGGHWRAFNTDVAGAARVLARLRAVSETAVGADAFPVTVLGDGGAADAIRVAAREHTVPLTIVRRSDVSAVTTAAIWSWPARVTPPPSLRFFGQPVAIIAYGPPANAIAEQIRQRGGVPLRLGAAWFIAQARQQRRLWENAE